MALEYSHNRGAKQIYDDLLLSDSWVQGRKLQIAIQANHGKTATAQVPSARLGDFFKTIYAGSTKWQGPGKREQSKVVKIYWRLDWLDHALQNHIISYFSLPWCRARRRGNNLKVRRDCCLVRQFGWREPYSTTPMEGTWALRTAAWYQKYYYMITYDYIWYLECAGLCRFASACFSTRFVIWKCEQWNLYRLYWDILGPHWPS